jgi:Zn-dependent M16 (insulinase) family peptidase
MNYEKHREVMELATRVDDMAEYSEYLGILLADEILVKLPADVEKNLKKSINIESMSNRILKKLNISCYIFQLNENDLDTYEAELLDSKKTIRERFLSQRELLTGRRLKAGYNTKGEI